MIKLNYLSNFMVIHTVASFVVTYTYITDCKDTCLENATLCIYVIYCLDNMYKL